MALAAAPLVDRLRLATLYVARSGRRLARVLRAPARAIARIGIGAPDRLVIAPQDIRTADPTRADDIYAGYFAFGGRIVNTQGVSPFDVPAPSREWRRTLAGFSWLRHLRAADTALSRANARALVDDFLAPRRSPSNSDVSPETAARRVLSWLSQSPLLLEGADGAFYRRFMRGLARDVAFLQEAYKDAHGAPRLVASIALAEYAMCAEIAPRRQARATQRLTVEIAAQILPDGGHIGRNPQNLLDLLLDLLPLRQTYAARSVAAPQALLSAIDRMLPMVRLLRHGDGALATFNGMGVTAPDRVATVLAYDDARAQPILNAPHSGYQRFQAGDAVVIVDAGRPPPPVLSGDAHAGALSFEFSVAADRIVVNCGTPAPGRPAARLAARQTAAHSTLTIDDTSSCHIAPDAGLERMVAGQILSGPRHMPVERADSREGSALSMAHDGYARRFGLIHERDIGLDCTGRRLEGADRLVAAKSGGLVKPSAFAIRFHLHPGVQATAVGPAGEIRLETLSGRAFVFETADCDVAIEESVFFAAPDGVRACQQLVLRGAAAPHAQVNWSFTEAT